MNPNPMLLEVTEAVAAGLASFHTGQHVRALISFTSARSLLAVVVTVAQRDQVSFSQATSASRSARQHSALAHLLRRSVTPCPGCHPSVPLSMAGPVPTLRASPPDRSPSAPPPTLGRRALRR